MSSKDKITVKREAAGFYRYSKGDRTVEVTQVDPNPAYGDTKPMWVAAAQWDHSRYTDPLDTKREAVAVAHEMLNDPIRR